ncbi:MAG: hypothetical protein JWO36_3158 [Myxococcales bacterium]|nr:hypothetical protein [Myxococcales bacterium]
MIKSMLVIALLASCGGGNRGAMLDGAPAQDAPGAPSLAFANVHDNQELETGFIVGTSTGLVPQVGCRFDGGAIVGATGTAAWKCPRPTSWKVGTQHVISAGVYDGSTLSASITASVYAAHNHDFNGDGYVDLAVGSMLAASGAGTVSIFYGSPSGVAATPDLTLTGPKAASEFGFALVAADIRGTGYADLAVGVASFSTSHTDTGTVYFFNGASSGLPSAPSYSLAGPALANAGSGYAMAAGDYNGDGLEDVAVGYNGYNTFVGQVFFYKGGAAGATFDSMMTGTSGSSLGEAIGLGDITGSGYASALVGSPSGVKIYPGGPSGIATTSIGSASERGAISVAYIQRGGFADLVIAGNAQAVIHYGSASGLSGTTTVSDGAQLGWGTAIAGDVDNDGHDDVVLANPCLDSSCHGGNALVFAGSSSGLATTASTTISGPMTSSQFGYALELADVNGDGRFDLEVSDGASSLWVYAGDGTATLYPASSNKTLTGVAGTAFSPR